MLVNDTDHELQSISAKMRAQRAATPRILQFTDLPRTFVALGDRQRNIPDLFFAEMLAFFRYSGCDTSRYREDGLVKDMRRMKRINALIEGGDLEVVQGVSEHNPRLFLVATRRTLTCTQLAMMDRWEVGLCCEECHRIGASYTIGLSGHRCQGEMCCRGAMILDDWPRVSVPLPEHADEW